MLNRLFSGDKEALQIVAEYDQLSRESTPWLFAQPTDDEVYETEMEAKSDRATDLFLEHDLYNYACYVDEALGIEETGLPEG